MITVNQEGVKGHLEGEILGIRLEPEVTSWGTGSEWKGGGHVFWGGRPLTSWEKKDRGFRSKDKTDYTVVKAVVKATKAGMRAARAKTPPCGSRVCGGGGQGEGQGARGWRAL